VADDLRAAAVTSSRPRVATVVATDDRPLVRAGLRAVLSDDRIRVAAVPAPPAALEVIAHHLPSVLVLSVTATDRDPFALVATATSLHPGLRVLIITDDASVADLRTALAAGADSVVLSSVPTDELTEAVMATARGDRVVSPEVALRLASAFHDGPSAESTLSPRELDVLRLLAEGLTNSRIGDRLGLSARTVKSHVQNLLGKLGARDRTGAVAQAFRMGLLR
jgi:DNA-binding NarL/FixJ family response regulator